MDLGGRGVGFRGLETDTPCVKEGMDPHHSHHSEGSRLFFSGFETAWNGHLAARDSFRKFGGWVEVCWKFAVCWMGTGTQGRQVLDGAG